MIRHSGSRAVELLLALLAPAASACGHCDEDRIATTYDFSIVSRALDQRHEVVFFAIQGAMGANGASADAIARLVEGIRGIDRKSVRVSVESTSLSFAYDPSRSPLGPLVKTANGRLGAMGLRLALLRVLDHTTYAKPAPIAAR